jgi:hypothetical protein
MTEGMPAQFDHCMRVYAMMDSESRTEEVDGNPEGMSVERKVWEGHTTRIFNDLRLSTPYYTSVMAHLKRMGCVEQLRRGGGSATSLWLLIREPTLDLYEKKGSGHVNPTTLTGRTAENERNIRELNRKMDIILQHLGVKL